MKSLVYQSSTGERVDLYCDALRVGQIKDLRSSAYSYSLGYRDISGVSSPAREVSLDAVSRDLANLDEACEVFDADVSLRSPGRIIVNGGWSQRAYMAGSEPSLVIPTLQKIAIKTLLLDGVWRKPTITQYVPSVVSGGPGLDLPTDLPFDLSPMSLAAVAENPSRLPASVKILIYGPATNPYVMLAGNRVQVDVTVPDGGYLEIDGITKTIIMTDANGDKTDCFDAGHRSTGEGSGEYVFEKLPPGSNEVSWQNSFGFDLTVYEERSIPPWSTL